MKIHIIDDNKYITVKSIDEIKKLVSNIFSQLTLPNKTEICITFINDLQMRDLNNSYRSIDRTTDVLSFPQDTEFLGDLVISYPTASKNSKRYKTSIKKELQRLIIHGILHLLDYDHKKKNERDIMRAKEKELFDYITGLKI